MASIAASLPVTSEYQNRAAWRAGVMGALNVVAVVLAVRLVLLVAVAGAIFLTVVAVNFPDPMRLGALAIYAVAVVIPTIWLSSRR